jgi:drug/metabolite transporter (DMT)-like permease
MIILLISKKYGVVMSLLWGFSAFGAAMLWGLVYTLNKKSLEYFAPVEMLAVLTTIQAMGLWAVFTIQGGAGNVTLWARVTDIQIAKWLLATAIIAITANFLILTSIKLSNATLAALVEVSYPLFTVLFSYLLFRTVNLNWDVAIGGVLIISGVLWIMLRAQA